MDSVDNSGSMSLVVQFVRELFNTLDLLVSQIIELCEFSVELIFESFLRSGFGGSNAHPFSFILLYLLAVIRFRLKEWINNKRELGG